MKRWTCIVMVLVLVGFVPLTFPTAAAADTYMKVEIKSSGLAGIGAMKGETETWLSGKRQMEKSKMDFSGSILRQFTKAQKTMTLSDLEEGYIYHIDEGDKSFEKIAIGDMKARVQATTAELKAAYREQTEAAEQPLPIITDGYKPRVDVSVDVGDDVRKIVGLPAKLTTLNILSTGVDKQSGEEVTYKMSYSVWLTPEFPGQQELNNFGMAYSEALGFNIEENFAGITAGLSSAGLSANEFRGHAQALQGFPLETSFSIGVRLSPEQRAELQKAMAEMEPKEEKKKGGLGGLGKGSIGGLGDKLKKKASDKVTGKISDEMSKAMFGEGISVDAEGDPVILSFETKVKKISDKSIKPEVFKLSDKFKLRSPR